MSLVFNSPEIDSINKFQRVKMYIFIKAVSDTVFDMINAVYRDKPLILSGLRFGRSSSPIIGQ